MTARRSVFRVLPILLLLATGAAKAAEPGVTATEIRIGSCSALTGPANFLGTQMTIGGEAYLRAVNDAGGVDIGVGSKTAYSPSFHQAFRAVFPTVLRNGEAVVFRYWSTVVSGPANQN